MGESHQLNRIARGGYVARGIVYLVIGFFAVLAAIGAGQAEDTQGALRTILRQPFGWALLSVVGIGFVAYAGWRFVQAIGDADRRGSGGKAILIRTGMFASGLIHIGLAAFAISLAFSLEMTSGSGSGGDPTSGWLSWVFGYSWARYVALGLALIPVGIGIAHIVEAWQAGFEKYFRADYDKMGVVKPVCMFGLTARGVTLIVIGILAFYGGGIYDAGDAPGLEAALSWIQGLPFGWLALLAVGLGLVAFAAYAFAQAAFRRIAVENAQL